MTTDEPADIPVLASSVGSDDEVTRTQHIFQNFNTPFMVLVRKAYKYVSLNKNIPLTIEERKEFFKLF